jgi:hypothetical protein
MSQVEFEPTIPLCEQAKTIHALGRAATVIGVTTIRNLKKQISFVETNKELDYD